MGIVPATDSDRSEQQILFRSVPVELIRSFLQQYRFHELNKAFSSDLLIGYVEEQNRFGDLLKWNVIVVTRRPRGDEPDKMLDLNLDSPIPLLNRSRLQTETAYASLGVIANGYRDIVADLNLSEEEIRKMSAPEMRAKRPVGIGLLLLYPIDKDSEPGYTGKKGSRNVRVPLGAVEHLLGVAFAFPPSSQATPQKYLTNSSVAPYEEEELLDDEES